MLGRKTYTRQELDRCRSLVRDQLAAYDALAAGAQGPALQPFEPLFFAALLLEVDRCFVHRVRLVAGKDGNPLNEVEVVAESLVTNDGVLQTGPVIKLAPEQSVLGLRPGDPVRLTRAQFERLADAFFAELEARFVEEPSPAVS